MSEEKSLEELGLTREQMFTPEAIAYWKQFSPEDFLLNFFYETMSSVAALDGYLGLLDKYVDLESIKLNDDLDAKKIHEILSKSTNRLRDAFGTMHDYQRHLKRQD